ncbi:hypothetical protein F5Y10DRAFT_288427 [Nemania abortiva]|nr:hypothetical protein F5Y10DRAFT_288427 [Nemania abortiva]
MPGKDSYISAPRYGYDFVVATTQQSINATMLTFLASRQEPVAYICYIADSAGKPERIDYNELKKRAHGTDPFGLPGTVDPNSTEFRNLLSARFLMGIRAQLGIPKVSDPTKVPDVVSLGADTSAVNFNMLCSDFVIVKLDPGSGYNPASWFRASQPKDAPWIFSSKVDLRLSTVGKSAYSTLPPDVQAQIKNMSGTAFSVQQLLFDLTNARLAGLPNISGIAPGTVEYSVLQQYFIGAYYTQLSKEGQPLLGCSIVQQTAEAATMTLTNMNLQVCPLVDSNGQPIPNPDSQQADLATLNYLCAADGGNLPPPVPFKWNWVDKAGASDHHGILSINRNTLANYFRQQMRFYVPRVCLQPNVRVWQDGITTWYQWGFSSGQSPTVTTPLATDPPLINTTVLKYSWNSARAYDEAGVNGALGAMELRSSFDMTVQFTDTRIIITQQLVVWLYAKVAATSSSANVYDKTITDTFTFGINAHGKLEAKPSTPDIKDNSKNADTNPFENFFTQFNDLTRNIKDWTKALVSQSQRNIPVDTVRDYVFPGGQTFTFKDARFSDYQDLTASITYADPGKSFTVPAAPLNPK